MCSPPTSWFGHTYSITALPWQPLQRVAIRWRAGYGAWVRKQAAAQRSAETQ